MRNSLLKMLPLMLLFCVSAYAASAQQDEQIKRGEYLAIAGDCGACHTDSGKPDFSGGHAIVSPIGTIYSTNITPSKTDGIGRYTLEQFSDALRKGKRADGSPLYPAMPYTAYAKLNDEDVSALYAYFMHGVAPVDQRPQATDLPFPFNLRFSMAAWNLLFLDKETFKPQDDRSQEWNRGAYLVQGLGHCSTCHTPRNFLMAEQQDKLLGGASLGTWFAPDITARQLTDTHWTREMLTGYLATGYADNGATAGGPMLEAIDKSFSRLTTEDRQAIAVYLLPVDAKSVVKPVISGLTPVTGNDTPAALDAMSEGQKLYLGNCAACHNQEGQGLNGLPALKNHPILQKPTADNVAMAILDGVWPEKGQGMPGFAHELSDAQIASLTNYLMKDVGGSHISLTSERVKELRNGGAASPLLMLARVGMIAGAVIVILIIGIWLYRRRRKTA
ncbi:cytochrome c [Rahnella sikkimica]|uniref:Cytochrome C n=1 Tax=Rahnella sikkimica TaxID=1805933 RepID=A0A2L1UXW8_9GAMM|nr:cytochrome c [Rahnella sikkimica]AVF37775.1 cytochrome C [Rahnella sikkimica]